MSFLEMPVEFDFLILKIYILLIIVLVIVPILRFKSDKKQQIKLDLKYDQTKK